MFSDFIFLFSNYLDNVYFQLVVFLLIIFVCPKRLIGISLIPLVLSMKEPKFLFIIPSYCLLFVSSKFLKSIAVFVVVVVIASLTQLQSSHLNSLVGSLSASFSSIDVDKRSTILKFIIDVDSLTDLIFNIISSFPSVIIQSVITMISPSIQLQSGLLYEVTLWSAGPWWYLQAQMLPEYACYFSILIQGVLVLTVALIYVNISKIDAIIGIHLTVFVVNYFRPSVTLFEVWLSVALLLNHAHIIKRMQSLPWICVGLLVPSVLSPLYTHLWLNKGTVNANFVFFQAYCMWIFLGLTFVEFVRAFLAYSIEKKEVSTIKGSELSTVTSCDS